ncbi:hypothetical protein AX774_g6787 [Zancudomyces culisetae]|uniref:Spp2/MOS2 G-patch domain-containing protein n=1 Tax=Zancudomyces culisetae TaxID=1213189 RepID=A0A1R1PFP3_ZANCU|nr:hypothetical protein AX774_g6787 [Zancudomyces culisetae]|eukprot:OMH79791.1 hypothetical protein AX774_g6787 [Zancudomyces culisetae]
MNLLEHKRRQASPFKTVFDHTQIIKGGMKRHQQKKGILGNKISILGSGNTGTINKNIGNKQQTAEPSQVGKKTEIKFGIVGEQKNKIKNVVDKDTGTGRLSGFGTGKRLGLEAEEQDEQQGDKIVYLSNVEGNKYIGSDGTDINAPLVIKVAENANWVHDRIIESRKKNEEAETDGKSGGIDGDINSDGEPRVEEQEYGLQTTEKTKRQKGGVGNGENGAVESESFGMREQREKTAYKKDIERIDAEMTLDGYKKVKVEDFGEALLRGMGWEEEEDDDDKGNKKQEEKLRPSMLGLGASLPPPEVVKIDKRRGFIGRK